MRSRDSGTALTRRKAEQRRQSLEAAKLQNTAAKPHAYGELADYVLGSSRCATGPASLAAGQLRPKGPPRNTKPAEPAACTRTDTALSRRQRQAPHGAQKNGPSARFAARVNTAWQRTVEG